MVKELKYKRFLLKVSGEALMGNQGFGIDPIVVDKVAQQIKEVHDMGAEIAIVVGGGNIFRGVQNCTKLGMPQASADYVGMLATVMNGSVLRSMLEKVGVPCRLMSAIAMQSIAEPYIRNKAIRHLEKGRVVIFSAGTGNPFFTTDTAAGLRAAEIDAQAMLMAKNKVDGIYDKDPRKFPDAQKFEKLSYEDLIKKDLKVMDVSAVSLCKDNKIPLFVFDFEAKDGIAKILQGENIGTYVGE